MLPDREPHPVEDFATAIENGRRICQARGYCGPFINAHVYDAFPDPLWRGIGECVHCRNTINRGGEELKRCLSLRGFRQIRTPVALRPERPPSASLEGRATLHHG